MQYVYANNHTNEKQPLYKYNKDIVTICWRFMGSVVAIWEALSWANHSSGMRTSSVSSL